MAELTLNIPDELLDELARRVTQLVQTQSQAQTEPQSPWLDFNAACVYLGFSRDALYKLTAARAIPVRKKVNGQGLRFHRGELDQWMREHYPRLDRPD